MNETLHKEILELQDELKSLKEASAYLDNVKEFSSKVEKTSSRLDKNYKESIDTINNVFAQYEELANETKHLVKSIEGMKLSESLEAINESVKDIESKFELIKKRIVDSNMESNTLIKNLNNQMEDGQSAVLSTLEKLSNDVESNHEDAASKIMKTRNLLLLFIFLGASISLATFAMIFFKWVV